MKKWKIILASVLALLVIIATPLSIMAQSNNESNSATGLKIRGGLAVVAPRIALVGKEMTLSVYVRYNQEPAANAGVWAVTRENIDSLKQNFQELKEAGIKNLTEQDYESALDTVTATWLGRTDENGKLAYTFDTTGNYVLVAIKAAFVPGWSKIAVRDALAIDAPKNAAPGEDVTITVTQRGTGNPVDEAGVWAVSRADIPALKNKLYSIRQSFKDNPQDADYESILHDLTISLGQTDSNGQLTCAFENAGGYLLITAKIGSWPGFCGIKITAPDSNATPDDMQEDTVN